MVQWTLQIGKGFMRLIDPDGTAVVHYHDGMPLVGLLAFLHDGDQIAVVEI